MLWVAHRGRLPIALAALVATTGMVSVWAPPATERAVAAPILQIAQSIPANTLIGRETAVEVTVTNTGDTTAYNLALLVRLPVGISVSSAQQPTSDVITETDAGGAPTGTVVAWENIVDIRPGGVFRFTYSLAHVVGEADGQWTVNETFAAPVEGYVSEDDAIRPLVTASPGGPPTTAVVTDFTQSSEADGSSTLVPFLPRKSEPSIEGELLRGVHEHQTVYTLSAETGALPGVEVGTLEDWIPAGIEFLGCGDEDNSRDEEYPGSGPLNPGNAPALTAPCFEPLIVETLAAGLPPGLAPGVYTHVVWEIGQTLPPNSVVELSYVAGIPQRANTTAWPDAVPSLASGEQGSNLDNNTGAFTTQIDEGTTWTNLATAESTFNGVEVDVQATESVEAVDLSVHKFVNDQTIQQGAVSTWLLVIETSEYVVADGIAGLTLVDTTPDGTCPIGSVNTTCTATAPLPTPPYSDSDLGPAPGETTLTWDLSGDVLGPSATRFVSFSTQALGFYADGGPVSANDSWANQVDLTADATTFGPAGPTVPDMTNPVTDDSVKEQSGTPVVFTKDVGRPANGATCGTGVDVAWTPDALPDIGPGDRVCFRLTVDPPELLDALEATLVDFLPVGFRFEDDSPTPGPLNEVPVEQVADTAVSGSPETGQRIEWTLIDPSFLQPSQTAQVVFSAVIDGAVPPDLGTSGDDIVNSARFSYENSNGEIFVVPDTGGVVFAEAHLTLTKGISNVDGAPFEPPVDEARNVNGGDTVTYAIDVANDGSRDAFGIEVRDLLPINNDGITIDDATCTQISAISNDGTCAGEDITWTGLSIPAGETLRLTYTWTLPDPVSAATSWRNEAGVVEYRSTTTTGEDFVYVPRDNIDPGREPDANTDRARDDAQVFSPGIALSKSRVTEIDEPGNALADQATIGETISFTVVARQTAETIVEDADLTDDLTGTGMALVAPSVQAYSAPAAPGSPCPTTGTPIPPFDPGNPDVLPAVRITGDRIEVLGPAGDLSTSPNDLCVVLTFDATVDDIPEVTRPDTVTNEAVLTFDADTTAGVVSRTVRASVGTQVVEPNLQIDKRASSAGDTVFPGASVTYTLVVTNQSSAQVSTAHDLVVTDDFSGASVDSVVDAGGGTVDDAAQTITWEVPSLAPGASVTLSYTVTLDSTLVAGDILENTATVVGTSLDGDLLGERTSDSACSPTACPGYIDTDGEQLTVDGPRVEKSTLRRLDTIGGVHTYVIRAILPANLDFGPDVVTLTDDLAGGDTAYVGTLNVFCAGCTPAERAVFQTPEQNGTSTSPDPRWDLAVFGPSATARQVFVFFRARVVNDPAIVDGSLVTDTATLTYVNDSLTDDATVEIAEPDVTIDKRVAGTLLDRGIRDTTPDDPVLTGPGLPITYRLDVTNVGGWTAYDTVVRDEPDSLSSLDDDCTGDARLVPSEVTSAPGADLVDGTLGPGDGCLEWRIPVLFPGNTVTIFYQLLVPDDFPRDELIIGPEFVNVASVEEYFGLFSLARDRNPDVRPYPDTPVFDEGHANLAGGALGDFVWLDIDGDGVQDTGEPGIPDVDVGVDLTGVGRFTTPRTSAGGIWLTDDGSVPPQWLLAGNYTIAVDGTGLPAGLVNTFDPDGNLDSVSITDLAENEVDLTQDFGYAGTGSVGDTVWLDVDGDGVQDSVEPGIPDVAVTVTWAGFDLTLGTADDVDYGTVTTDASGIYLVDLLPAGPVRVDVDESTLPPGLVPTFDLDGGDDSTAVRVLGPGEDATDVDFGYSGTAIVGDLVWLDRNGDGLVGPLDPGLPSVAVSVTWEGFDGTLGTADDVLYGAPLTDALGLYLVGFLPPGEVLVEVDTATLAPGLEQTFDPDGVLDDATVRTLTFGQVDLDADFGYRGVNIVGDLVWLDIAADRFGPDTPPPDDQPDDPGVPGQLIGGRWAGVDGILDTPDDVIALTATGPEGRWQFDGVPDGLGRVRLLGDPFAQLDVTADPDPVLDGLHERTIPTADDLDIDFGLAGSASVGDLVWLDLNGDDVQDPGEPGIPGVDVTVVWAGFDGTLGTDDDVGYGTVTTSADGLYLVEHIPAGPVRVTVDEATLPPGVSASFDLDGGADSTADRELAVGEAARDVDFGYVGTGSAGDFVWWDLNSDGAQDPGEPGFPGVTVTLEWAGFDGTAGNADDVVVTAATDTDGRYLFELLPAGEYVVTIDTATLPTGLTITADPDDGDDSTAAFSLAPAESNLDLDFGYAGERSIGDLVWRDTNRDGTRQPSEEAIGGAGLTITYLGADGVTGGGDDISFGMDTAVAPVPRPAGPGFARAAVPAMLQQIAGGGVPLPGEPFYDAVGLVDGTYVIALDASTLPAGDAPFADRDGGDPARATVVLAGVDVDDADFAVFRNDPPTAGSRTGIAACGTVVEVDPTAGVTDPNGGPLTLVAGSAVAPTGVTVAVTPSGQLRITTAQSVTADYTVTWQVADDGGARVTVTLSVDVTCISAEAGSSCAEERPYFWWRIQGSAAQAPLTLRWYDGDGTLRETTIGQPLEGSAWWPSGTWVDRGEVRITATDGATAGPFELDDPCAGALPSTGARVRRIVIVGLGLVLTGLALFLLARRRIQWSASRA